MSATSKETASTSQYHQRESTIQNQDADVQCITLDDGLNSQLDLPVNSESYTNINSVPTIIQLLKGITDFYSLKKTKVKDIFFIMKVGDNQEATKIFDSLKSYVKTMIITAMIDEPVRDRKYTHVLVYLSVETPMNHQDFRNYIDSLSKKTCEEVKKVRRNSLLILSMTAKGFHVIKVRGIKIPKRAKTTVSATILANKQATRTTRGTDGTQTCEQGKQLSTTKSDDNPPEEEQTATGAEMETMQDLHSEILQLEASIRKKKEELEPDETKLSASQRLLQEHKEAEGKLREIKDTIEELIEAQKNAENQLREIVQRITSRRHVPHEEEESFAKSSFRNDTNVINCILTNVRSLRPNKVKQELKEMAMAHNLQIIAITETWFQSDTTEADAMLPNFNHFRADRLSDEKGGGVILYIHNAIHSEGLTDTIGKTVDSSINYDGIDWIAALCKTSTGAFLVCCVYRTVVYTNYDILCNLICRLCEYAQCKKLPILILGDFNAAHIDWSNTASNTDRLLMTIKEKELIQFVQVPTRLGNSRNSILDLVLSNDEHFVHGVTCYAPIAHSDHLIVYFQVNT